jgi:hypothetical protein
VTLVTPPGPLARCRKPSGAAPPLSARFPVAEPADALSPSVFLSSSAFSAGSGSSMPASLKNHFLMCENARTRMGRRCQTGKQMGPRQMIICPRRRGGQQRSASWQGRAKILQAWNVCVKAVWGDGSGQQDAHSTDRAGAREPALSSTVYAVLDSTAGMEDAPCSASAHKRETSLPGFGSAEKGVGRDVPEEIPTVFGWHKLGGHRR